MSERSGNARLPSSVPDPARLPEVIDEPRMPAGFACGGVACGIKLSGRPDLAAFVVSGRNPAAAAATFTANRMAAAPVHLSREHLAATGSDGGASGYARGVLVTSGCANAATGSAGDADQAEVARLAASAFGCEPAHVLVASTGLIGTRLPLDRVSAGLDALVPDALSERDDGLAEAAEAIQTTDSRLKSASATIQLASPDGSSHAVTVSGVVKGVGMIHPQMATMIAVVLTDAAAAPATLSGLLREAVGATFDQLTVDGDTSTNDTVFLVASGAAGTTEVEPGTPAAARLGAALTAVCRSLARQQAADGEGATSLITCRVVGGADLADARAVARTVVASSLVKTAVHGRDPNWGRVAAAAGAARRRDGEPVSLGPETLRISLCGIDVYGAEPLDFDAAAVSRAMEAPEVVIELDLGRGSAAAEAWGCDLSEEYVRENSEYST